MVKIKSIALALSVAVLAGCASKPIGPTQTVEVKIPVREACKTPTPAQPAWVVPSVAKGADIFEQMKALLVDRELGFGYQKELETALETCKR